MCSDHANVSANQRGGKTWGGGLALRRGELNKDVSRPDGEGEREREERHAWKVIKAA